VEGGGLRLDAERPLARRRQHLFEGELAGRGGEQPQPRQPGPREDQGVAAPLLQAAKARGDVPAQVLEDQVRPQRADLGLAPQAGGADARAGRGLAQPGSVARDPDVMRILARGDGGDGETGRGLGRQVLQRVDGDVAVAGEQRGAQGRGEDAGAAGDDQRAGGHIARRGDRDDLDVVAEGAQACGTLARLALVPENQHYP